MSSQQGMGRAKAAIMGTDVRDVGKGGWAQPSQWRADARGTVTRLTPAAWREWVFGRQVRISRGLCQYQAKRLDATRPAALQIKALALAAQTHSPYRHTGRYIVVTGDIAQIWTWDATALSASGVAIRNCLPESAADAPGVGFRLREWPDGFEGQFWTEEALAASRWWPQRPSERQWAMFASSAEPWLSGDVGPLSTLSDAEPPVTRATAWRWPANRLPGAEVLRLLRPVDWSLITVGLVLAPFAFLGSRYVSLQADARDLRADIAELQSLHGGKSAALSTARAQAARFDALASALNVPSPLLALSDAAQALDAVEARPESVTAVDGLLSVGFETSAPLDRVGLVGSLERQAHLSDVSLLPGRRAGDWTVEARMMAPSAALADGVSAAPDDVFEQ